MKQTTIDRSLLPNMWLTWETTKGKFYLDCATGVKQDEKPEINFSHWLNNNTYHLINSNSKPRYAYAKYHADIERLELAEVTIETTRKEEVKNWSYSGNKYFLGKDKSVIDANGNIVINNFILSRGHVGRTFNHFLSWFNRIAYGAYIVNEFKKLLGAESFTISSGRVVNVTNAWHIQEWYKTSQKVRKPGKQQKLTDKLTEMSVKNMNEIANQYNLDTSKECHYYYSKPHYIYFERLNDGWSVLRVFRRGYNANEVNEYERMYIHDDGANRIVTPSEDKWVPARQLLTWSNHKFLNREEAMEKCKRIKYILPLLSATDEKHIHEHLITILRFPELEQLINLGYHNQMLYVLNNNTAKADLYHMFGDYYNEKETTILRKAGLTKHQLDKCMSVRAINRSKSERALKEMRKMFGDKLIHLDNDTFDNYYDGFVAMDRGWGREPFEHLAYINGLDKDKFIKNAFRLGKKHSNVYTMLDDTIRLFTALNRGTQPEINWYFDSYSDVVRAHDAIDTLKRAQDEERRAIWDKEAAERLKREEKKRIELDKERKKYEYEDDNYIIRLPVDANEIVREGSMQRICIGGYTSSHALGRTNLFFLRRKSEPAAPFYAIEMNNNDVIVQIHGHSNSWLGNNPEAIPTVVRWLRKNGIKCDEKILTCKAKGYGAINDYVPMPVVD
jgi:hypothetical protein